MRTIILVSLLIAAPLPSSASLVKRLPPGADGIVASYDAHFLDSRGAVWELAGGTWQRRVFFDPPFAVADIAFWEAWTLVTTDDRGWTLSQDGTWEDHGSWPSPSSVPSPSVPVLSPSLRSTPNPTATTTDIQFGLTRACEVSIAVYDVSGAIVRRLLARSTYPAGSHAVEWDGRDDRGVEVPSGLYLARTEAGDVTVSGRIIVTQ